METEKYSFKINKTENLEVYCIGPCAFHNGFYALEFSGLELVTAEEFATASMLAGHGHPVTCKDTWRVPWVSENVNYWQNGDILIASREHNPILKCQPEATNAEADGKKFYLETTVAQELRERAERNPEKALQSGVLLLEREKLEPIEIAAFDDHPLTRFLKWRRDQYGAFLREEGQETLRLNFEPLDVETFVGGEKGGVRSYEKPYAHGLSISGCDKTKILFGYQGLHGREIEFGSLCGQVTAVVRQKSAESKSDTVQLTPKEIKSWVDNHCMKSILGLEIQKRVFYRAVNVVLEAVPKNQKEKVRSCLEFLIKGYPIESDHDGTSDHPIFFPEKFRHEEYYVDHMKYAKWLIKDETLYQLFKDAIEEGINDISRQIKPYLEERNSGLKLRISTKMSERNAKKN